MLTRVHALERHTRPHLIKAVDQGRTALSRPTALASCLYPACVVRCGLWVSCGPPTSEGEAQPPGCPSPLYSLRPSYHTGEAALSAVEEAQRPLDEAQYSCSVVDEPFPYNPSKP